MSRQPGKVGYAKGRRRRALILAAAGELFAHRGLSRVTLRDVAETAAVPKSVVLYYFGDREQLIGELLDGVLTPLLDAQREAVDGAGDPREQLRRWLDVQFDAAAGVGPMRLHMQVAVEGAPDSATKRLRRYDRAAANLLSVLLERGHRDYCWQSPDPQASAVAVRALVDGMRLACLKEGSQVDIERLANLCRRAVLDLLVRM